ncbi:MAG: hypothetical protein KGV50_01755 [Gammaproteobacteria bacterium]|nr:hypothetical protein [Gammaproteobacteria bacterium]
MKYILTSLLMVTSIVSAHPGHDHGSWTAPLLHALWIAPVLTAGALAIRYLLNKASK